ncbi:MAG: 16S rRNA processing protein RimM [Bacilli bacterium]|nr:16S rRNA processing protein RimM [Bacilli bacterium]
MIYIGKLVNTHGIKGEVRIISSFKYKEEVFKKDSIIYIKNQKYKINSYRKHKQFDMVTLEGINDINDAIPLKGSLVYINREDYNFSGLLNEDLYGKKVYDKDKYIGVLKNIRQNGNQELLEVEKDNKKYLIPYVKEFVKSIDEDIHLNLIKGFIDED